VVDPRVDEIRKEMRKQLTGQSTVVEPGFDATSLDSTFTGTVERRHGAFFVGERILVHGILLVVEKVTKKYVKLHILPQSKEK